MLSASVSRSIATGDLISNDLPFAFAVSTSGQDIRALDVIAGADADHFIVSASLPRPSVYRLWIATDFAVFELALLANR